MKFKKIEFTQELVRQIVDTVMDGRLPDDTVVVGARISSTSGRLELLIYSSQFTDLPEGTLPEAQAVTVDDLMMFGSESR